MYYNFLSETTGNGGGCGMLDTPLGIGLLVALGLAFALMIILPRFTRRRQKAQMESIENVLVGDKIMTVCGIIGIVIEVKKTTTGKEVLLETGSDTCKSTIWIDVRAVGQNLTRPPVPVDFFGRPKAGVGTTSTSTTESSPFNDEISHDLEEPKPIEIKTETIVEECPWEAEEKVVATETSISTRPKTTSNTNKRTKTTTSRTASRIEETKPFEDDGGW